MQTDAKSQGMQSEIVEEISQSFRPIELLFDVMGAADSGVQGVFVRRWAEIGLQLAASVREQLDKLTPSLSE